MAWAEDYVTSTALKAYVRIADSVDDVQIGLAIAAASRSIDSFTGRQFAKVGTAEARTYVPRADYFRKAYVVDIDDLSSESGLEVLLDGVDVTADVELYPYNADKVGKPWTRLILPTYGAKAVVTGVWGWPSVPSAIQEGTLMQANRYLHRRDAWQGVAGSPDIGSELRLLSRLDPDVQVIVAPYRREVAF